MTDPLDHEDDWAELARELARDKPAAPEPAEATHADTAEAVEPHHGDPRAEDAAVAEGDAEAAADEEFDDAEEGAAEAGEPVGEGDQPGTGRKRRRRRRRRRKGGTSAEGAAATTAADADEAGEGEGEAEPVAELEEEPVAGADDYDVPSDDLDTEPAPLSVEEDTASEVLRELIAHWNVPSWDEIVTGLYRPG